MIKLCYVNRWNSSKKYRFMMILSRIVAGIFDLKPLETHNLVSDACNGIFHAFFCSTALRRSL